MVEDKKKKQEQEIFQEYYTPPTGTPNFLKSLGNKPNALSLLREKQEELQKSFFAHSARPMESIPDIPWETMRKQKESEERSGISALEQQKNFEESQRQSREEFQQQAFRLSQRKLDLSKGLDLHGISSDFENQAQNVAKKARDVKENIRKTKELFDSFGNFFIEDSTHKKGKN